ncbi:MULTISPECIES: YheC/YheD family protein [Bacillaceae]|uniref:YheC/YheD family protein n=1 Tax=Evansella alkalicola TaxID=745819 RepID=A0ABS6JYF0_9BACI|nr:MULTISPECIES: YheC/YheD family protein [Bacillaceae]MBU9723617.1 YheC/YheD family protein [Bacillus alkalicola]
MKIEWLQTSKKNTLFLSEQTRKNYNLKKDKVTLHYGAWKRRMFIKTKNDLSRGTFGIPKGLFDHYTVPSDLQYQVMKKGNSIFIGPIIAFVPKLSTIKKLKTKDLKKFNKRMTKYHEIKGLVFICGSNDINIKNQSISGYYYNPNVKSKESSWVYGTFPYPSAVYTRTHLKKKVKKELVRKIGTSIFNDIFNKWTFRNIVHSNKETRKFLPHTEQFTDVGQVKRLLKRYNTIYLKPRYGSLGKGIVMIRRRKRSYVLMDPYRKKRSFSNWSQLHDFLKKFLTKNYIIQQGVPTKYQKRNVDFRIYMQKDKNREWQVQGLVARVAKKGSVITNSHHRYKALYGHELIKKMFSLSQEETNKVITEINNASIKVCKVIDKSDKKIGDVALDLIIDKNLKIWFLELNLRYQHTTFNNNQFPDIYKKIMPVPLEYAKTLSGFDENKNDRTIFE